MEDENVEITYRDKYGIIDTEIFFVGSLHTAKVIMRIAEDKFNRSMLERGVDGISVLELRILPLKRRW